ncbi:bstEII [Candidatus Saccharibacteria bacterium]|nr:bstEII [Candidatus Saccharibacteria bacterium]
MKQFGNYKDEAADWITLENGDYYPDIIPHALDLYSPVLASFKTIMESAESSEALFRNIQKVKAPWMRDQLLRVFRKYVYPMLPVELYKKKYKTETICTNFAHNFRSINEVQHNFALRPFPDETLCAILWEYKDRGRKGYSLAERFFSLFKERFNDLTIEGPTAGSKDIPMQRIFPDYPNAKRPVDFVIKKDSGEVVAVGFAHYDSDRGGSQEDDRPGGYKNTAKEILKYITDQGRDIKILFVNDGPGLLMSSMWDEYTEIEELNKERIMVLTLRMFKPRLSREWLFR